MWRRCVAAPYCMAAHTLGSSPHHQHHAPTVEAHEVLSVWHICVAEGQMRESVHIQLRTQLQLQHVITDKHTGLA